MRRQIKHVPVPEFSESLPITSKKDEIIRAVNRHPVVIVSGETGSGKTTQIPKMCLAAGRGRNGMIGCTQPRRIAAVSMARRIAEELGEPLGRSVGFQVRFQDKTPKNALIKLMTDGILLAETRRDRYLRRYDTIIVDEAHERSLNIDFILGLLRRIQKRRKDLKVIITSATIDTEKFSRAFGGAPVISVSGRMYPVDVSYQPLAEDRADGAGRSDAPAYVSGAAEAVAGICGRTRNGDILVFMPTEQDIRDTCKLLGETPRLRAEILPLFARLAADRQARIFRRYPARKIIVATNIAETSLTIPGIRYVVDTGLARISRYIPRTRITALPISPISKSSADQRKGRAGRVSRGVCIRLFSEADYQTRPAFTRPEIQRANLAEVILRMTALGMGEVEKFPFLDPPTPQAIRDGSDLLFELGALEKKKSPAGKMSLTRIGRIMAGLPLDPRLSRMLIAAAGEGCLKEVCVLAAALSIQDPRRRPAEEADAADEAHKTFLDPLSDFVTCLNIWNRYRDIRRSEKKTGRLKRFCREHYLSFRRMREWGEIERQIRLIIKENRLGSSPKKKPPQKQTYSKTFGERYAAIHRAVLCGFLSNIAIGQKKNMYTAAKGRHVMLFPGSGLFGREKKWIVAAEYVETSRLFARTAAAIDERWLEPLGRDLCKYACFDPKWDPKRGEVTVTEQVSLFGLIIVPGRQKAYGRINSEDATNIFIREALVGELVDSPLKFMIHNRRRMEEIRAMENKLRKRDLLVDDETLVAFYTGRLRNTFDIRTLKHRIRKQGDVFLRMTGEDLLRRPPDPEKLSRYPDRLSLGEHRFPVTYHYAPGEEADGVTVRIPAVKAPSIRSGIPPDSLDGALDRLVPGLFREKLTALIKGLPKAYRKRLVPVAERVDTILREFENLPDKKQTERLATILSEVIHRRFGVQIPADAWPTTALPDHLRTRIVVLDASGKTVAAGRDAGILKTPHALPARGKALDTIRKRWERDHVETWDMDHIPEAVSFKTDKGGAWEVYPALVVEEKPDNGVDTDADAAAVHLRIFFNFDEAVSSHKKGVAVLYARHFSKQLKLFQNTRHFSADAVSRARYLGGENALIAQVRRAVIQRLFCKNIRAKSRFDDYGEKVFPEIFPLGERLIAAMRPLLAEYAATRAALSGKGKGAPPMTVGLADTFLRDLDRLIPFNFPVLYQEDRFSDLARYVKAIRIRARRAAINPEKDRFKAAKTDVFSRALDDMISSLSSASSGEKQAAVEAFHWMIEEFKVSIFAQELKTAYPVSEKRLEKEMKRIERMA